VTGVLRLAREIGSAAAVGYGQVLFCESAAGGILLLLGTLLLAPRAALAGALACLAATGLARALRYPAPEWRRGLYGYTAALAGIFWGVLFAPDARAWAALGLAAALAPPVTRLAHRLLTPHDLPPLAGPALVFAWLAWPLLSPAPPTPGPDAAREVVAWSLIFGGLGVYSRLLALAAAVGALVGVGLVLGLGSAAPGAVLANTVATAAALGAVFVPASASALAVAAGAAAGAGALWAPLAGRLPLPPLVAPFTAITLGILAILRAPAVRRRLPGAPWPQPLVALDRPEAGRAWWLARRRLAALVAGARRVCVLTGAGVSTGAGLPDVRGPRGLWTRTRRITLDEFVHAPEQRARYWDEEERFFRLVRRARPGPAHDALVELYRRGRLSAVVTQNVDGLHQAAGLPAEAVIELHGSIAEAVCLDCGARVPRAQLSPRIAAGDHALYCPACQGLLKGGSLMFGEPVSAACLDAALRALLASDLLLVLGTSLHVAPATDLLRWARQAGIPIAIVNAAPTPYDAEAAVAIRGDVTAVLLDLLAHGAAEPRGEAAAAPGSTAPAGWSSPARG
jgi:NAD-dependent deacetylase